jgi:hypothetical protein
MLARGRRVISKPLDPGSTHIHVLSGMKALHLDPVSSAIHGLHGMGFTTELDPGSTYIPVLAGMKASCLHLPA